jgi:C4-dicarboxylate-binding protein DctP
MYLLMIVMVIGLLLGACVDSNIKEEAPEPAKGKEATLGENPTDDEINNFITATSDKPDKIVLRYASTSADLNGQSYLRGCRAFLQVLKEEMGDKIQIEYYLNGTFGGTADAIIGGLQNGNFELSDWPLASFAEYTNAFQPLDVPYLVADAEEARTLYLGEAGKIMKEKCMKDTNVIPLFYGQIGMRQITNSRNVIKTPEDMKGLKLRVQNNPIHIASMKALGASPTTLPFSELFTALQQKTVDG